MVKEISKNISIPHKLLLLRLSDFDIKPCKACYKCLFKDERCIRKDDFNLALNSIIDADALIVAAPAYFLGANSCLKRFLDRGLAFYAHVDKLWGKPAVGVGIAGIKGKEGYTLLGIESFLSLILSKNKQSTVIYGALPGEIFLNDDNKQVAFKLATSLFGPVFKKSGPTCPLCGGDTFRFLDKNMVRCMLCSNAGTVLIEKDPPVFEINQSEHELFLTKEQALEHRAWLIGMKDRFVKHKEKLKEISLAYRSGGVWIKP